MKFLINFFFFFGNVFLFINDEVIIYERIVETAGSAKIDKKQRGMVMKAMKSAAADGVFYDMTVVNKVLTRMMEG